MQWLYSVLADINPVPAQCYRLDQRCRVADGLLVSENIDERNPFEYLDILGGRPAAEWLVATREEDGKEFHAEISSEIE